MANCSYLIADIFRQQVTVYRKSLALTFGDVEYTYEEIDYLTDYLALQFQNLGISIGDVICLYIDRSELFLLLPLAIAKLGAVYVPLDCTLPLERVKAICIESHAKIIIVDKKYEYETLLSIIRVYFINPKDIYSFNHNNKNNNHTLNETIIDPEAPFVIFFTSGSTGKPKGVIHNQKAVAISNQYDCQKFNFNQSDRFLSFSNFGFVLSLRLFQPMFVGAHLYIASAELREDITLLNSYIEDKQITVMSMPAQVGYLFCKLFYNSNIKLLTVVGGVMPSLKHFPSFKIINGYGSTECISASYMQIAKDTNPNSLGFPCSHCHFYINKLDDICIENAGELLISGDCVCIGYTKEYLYSNDTFSKNYKNRIFHTGDIVKKLDNGEYIYIGRKDDFIKLRDLRVDINEINLWISKYPGISQVVTCLKNKNGRTHLCYFYVSESDKIIINHDDVIYYLRSHLPEYMIPSYGVHIHHVPLTTNGKIDYEALTLPACKTFIQEDILTENEILIKICVEKVLSCKEPISIHNSFQELGGDSLGVMELISEIRNYGKEITMRQILDSKSLKEVAYKINEQKTNIDQHPVCGSVKANETIKNIIKYNTRQNINLFCIPELFESDETIKIDDIENVLDILVKHHDMLRAVIRNDSLFIRTTMENNLYRLEEVKCISTDKTLIENTIYEFHKSANFFNGTALQALIIHTTKKDLLFIEYNHLVSDAVSKNIFKNSIVRLYQAIKNKKPYILPLKTDSYVSYCTSLIEYKKSANDNEKKYWHRVSKFLEEYPIIYHINGNCCFDVVHTQLDMNTTNRIISATQNDSKILESWLITIVARIVNVSSIYDFCIQVIRHGRNPTLLTNNKRSLILDQTIGLFACSVPLVIKQMGSHSIIDDFKKVKHAIDNMPNQGIGFGILEGYKTNVPLYAIDFLGKDTDNKDEDNKNIRHAKGFSLNRTTQSMINMGSGFCIYARIKGGSLRLQARYDTSAFCKEGALRLLNLTLEQLVQASTTYGVNL